MTSKKKIPHGLKMVQQFFETCGLEITKVTANTDCIVNYSCLLTKIGILNPFRDEVNHAASFSISHPQLYLQPLRP